MVRASEITLALLDRVTIEAIPEGGDVSTTAEVSYAFDPHLFRPPFERIERRVCAEVCISRPFRVKCQVFGSELSLNRIEYLDNSTS